MQIYFAASISGGRKFLDAYIEIVQYLQAAGHTIPTEHIVDPHVLHTENKFSDAEIYDRDVQWISESDCMIAEVSNPSLGVGYEICYALNLGKPVLCLCQDGIFLTRMLTGNSRDGLHVEFYTKETWKTQIEHFLTGVLEHK